MRGNLATAMHAPMAPWGRPVGVGQCSREPSTATVRLMGATTIIGVDTVPERLSMAGRLGANILVNFKDGDPVEQIMEATDGRGVDASIEALGTQGTFT